MPSGLYIQGPDKWTSSIDKAKDFKKVSRALKFVQTSGLEEMEVAFAFDNPAVTTVPVEKIHPALVSSGCAILAALLASAGRGGS